jgi:hypothetical protein
MLERVIATGVDLVPDSLHFDVPSNAVWASGSNGSVVTVRLLDQRVEQLGFGYRRPIAAVPGHDGLTVAVVERRGRVWLARRDQASRNRARMVAAVPGRVLAARRHPDPGTLLLLTTGALDGAPPGPTLVSCDLADGSLRTLTSELARARTFVVDEQRREVVVLSRASGVGRTLTSVDLDSGAVTAETDTPQDWHTLATSPDPGVPGVLAVYSDPASEDHVSLVRDDGTVAETMDLARSVTGMARWGSLLLASSGAAVVAVEWDLKPGTLPLTTPLGPLFVNGYARLDVDLASAGLDLQDVTFAVIEGAEVGIVSAGVEPPNPDGTQPVLLVAGCFPGEYHVEITRNSDGRRLALRRFRVTTCWPDEAVGPPVSVTGTHQTFKLMSWGGAGSLSEYLAPAPEVWRVVVVLVSTKDRRWGGLETGARNDWKDRTVGGGDSVRRFYEEVSYRNTAGPPTRKGMTVQLVGDRVFGPVDLDEGWGDVFMPKDPADVNAGWMSKPTGKQIMAGAISAHLADQPEGARILELADSVAVIVRSGTDTPTAMGTAPPLPTRYVWGHASHVDFWRKTATTFTEGPKPAVFMTDKYPAGLANAPVLAHTLTHEIGHNLGLDDLYDARGDFPAEVNARSPAKVDLMASSRPLPHFSLANRIRLGWVDRAWLRRFDFSASPVGGSVTLQATETLTRNGPGPGRIAGIEVPIKDGWSYLFEFRREQPGQIGDQLLDRVDGSPRFVLGTDLRVRGAESARPPILFLPEDVDADGPVLDVDGRDYRDSDVTNPERMHDFTLKLNHIEAPDANSAEVEVKYQAAHRPQLQIRSAPGRGDFKSPDIGLIGPFGTAVPGVLKGMPNTIKVTVHNLGTLPATKVQVHVRWLPFTVSGANWRPLPDPPQFSVPATGITSFVVPWDLPASVKVGDTEVEHFCVRVDIDRYRDLAHPDHEEIVTFDNWAQSNFDAVSLPFGSPSDRVRTVGTTSNPLQRPATYLFTADQSSPWYRMYVGNAWLRLPAGGTRPLEIGYESLAGDAVFGPDFEKYQERITSTTHHAAVTSWQVPENTECDTPREWWGVGLDLRAGRRTWIEDVRRNGELVTASVRTRIDGVVADVTGGEIHLAAWPQDEPARVVHTQGIVGTDGTARVLLSNETLQALDEGRRVLASLARPADGALALAVTRPEQLR